LKKKNKGIHWVQHGMTAASQQWLPPAQVLLQIEKQGCHGCDRIVVRLITTYMQSVTVTTKVVSFNRAHGEMYTKQHYVIKLVSDLREVGGFDLVFLH
jgi:hypothetical protein